MSPWILPAFFLVVAAGVVAAGWLWSNRAQTAAALAGSAPGPATPPAVMAAAEPDPFVLLLQKIGEVVPASRAEAAVLKKRLVAAGYRGPSAVPVFYGIQCSATLAVAVAMAWIAWQTGASSGSGIVAVLASAGFAYMMAERTLISRIRARRARLATAVPDALDLMVLSLEAGQALDQAMVDASNEIRGIYPDLSAELALVHLELRAGSSRAAGLRNLADRSGEPELRKLANVLIQSDRFGTSLAPALRIHARYLRLRRKQQVEETARKIGVKLIFPIFFLIFPCLLLVTVGPALLQLYTQLLPMLRQP